jgi:acetyl esterase/lipase
VTITPDVVYGHKDGMALTYDVFRPANAGEKPGPCLLLMVSGGWVSQWMPPAAMLPFTKPFLDRGYTVCAVRHGSSPKYLIPEIVTDVRSALEHVTDHAAEHRIDRDRLGIFGFSAGGHLSLMLGTTTNAAARGRDDKPRVAAVAAVFPPTDLTPYLDPAAGYLEQFPALKFPRENCDSYSPLKQVSDDDAPSLMVHGDKDELVPLWHSEKIRDALRASDVAADLVVIEGAGHGFNAAGNETMFRAMVEWFDTHLRADP